MCQYVIVIGLLSMYWHLSCCLISFQLARRRVTVTLCWDRNQGSPCIISDQSPKLIVQELTDNTCSQINIFISLQSGAEFLLRAQLGVLHKVCWS